MQLRLLWLFDGPVVAELGGTERVTVSLMQGLEEIGHSALGVVIINRNEPGFFMFDGRKSSDLRSFLFKQNVDVVINQVAYSPWLLDRFYELGGGAWRASGGRVISCLHFDPINAPIRWAHLRRGWTALTLRQKTSLVWRAPRIPYYNLYTAITMRSNYRRVYARSDLYVLLSDSHVRPFCRRAGIKEPERLAVIVNPLTYTHGASEEDLDKKKPVVLVVSRLDEPQKRLSLALKAWRVLLRTEAARAWTLVFVGEGPERRDYEMLIDELSLKRIEMVGRQPPEAFYRQASILWMTSPREGWGQVITEAQQFGVVPIVMNTSSVFADIISHKKNGILVCKNDAGALAAATAEVMADKLQRDCLARNAVESTKRFQKDQVVRRWNRELARLCDAG